MMAEGSSTPSHKWKSVDGSTLESKTTFPPFQSIILESGTTHAKACPLLTDTGNQLSGIDKRVQSVSEQLNWTNTALRGMATQVYQTESNIKPEQINDLQVSSNTATRALNLLQDRVITLDSKVDKTLQELASKHSEKLKTDDIIGDIGTALSNIGTNLTELKKKKQDRPIPDSFLRAPPPLSILTPVYNPAGTSPKQKFSLFFSLLKKHKVLKQPLNKLRVLKRLKDLLSSIVSESLRTNLFPIISPDLLLLI